MLRCVIILACVGMSVIMASCQHNGRMKCDNIYIDTTSTLYAFYPHYRGMKWVCSDSPDEGSDSILFCCTAAFSKDYSIGIGHDKIWGSHVAEGAYYEGYRHHLINGAFIYKDGEYAFLHDSLQDNIRLLKGMPNAFAFCQMRLDTTVVTIPPDSIYLERFGWRGYNNLEGKLRLSKTTFKYRTLCEKDRRLCIIESKEEVTLTQFRKNLNDYGVTHALYLDTGVGWSYSWYRDNNNEVQVLHPHVHPFNTNWLIFYK